MAKSCDLVFIFAVIAHDDVVNATVPHSVAFKHSNDAMFYCSNDAMFYCSNDAMFY